MTKTNRAIAHYHAFDLARAIIEHDTCKREHLAEYRATNVDETFRQLAASLGYVVATTREVTAARVREMNAELPADQREVMQLKGMI